MPEEILEPLVTEKPVETPEGALATPELVSASEAAPKVEGTMERSSEQYSKILSQVKPGTGRDDTEVDDDAESVGAQAEAEQKVHMLVELAQVKGVTHAVRVAKRLNDLYILDTMHDELADKLYDGLLAKGLITKE